MNSTNYRKENRESKMPRVQRGIFDSSQQQTKGDWAGVRSEGGTAFTNILPKTPPKSISNFILPIDFVKQMLYNNHIILLVQKKGKNMIPPQVTVNSRHALRHGTMTNGVHTDKWFVVEDYRLEYAERVRTCQSCYRNIEVGEVYGVKVESLHYPLLCSDCLAPIPPDAQIWRVSRQMRRKSKKHPDGIRHEFEVCKPDQMADYMRRLTAEYPGSTCEAVGAIDSTFARIDALVGDQRAAVMQMIDAAGLPLEGTAPSPRIHGGEVYDFPAHEVMTVIDFDNIEEIEF